MRKVQIALGTLLATSVAVGITVSQAELKVTKGQADFVVASVNRGRVYEMPLAERCLWVGVPAGIVGGAIGCFASNGANLSGAIFGALTLWALSADWRETWPDKFGRAGANSQLTDSLSHGLVGGLLGAVAVAHLAKHHERLPRRLQPPQPMDA